MNELKVFLEMLYIVLCFAKFCFSEFEDRLDNLTRRKKNAIKSATVYKLHNLYYTEGTDAKQQITILDIYYILLCLWIL